VKVPRPCAFVLPVKVGWRPNIVLGGEDGKVMGCALLGGERFSIGGEFCVWRAAF
jgi:hypothetical protein